MAEEGFEPRSDHLRSLWFFMAKGSLLGEAQKGIADQQNKAGPAPSLQRQLRLHRSLYRLFISRCQTLEQLFPEACKTPSGSTLSSRNRLSLSSSCAVLHFIGCASFSMYWAVLFLFINLLSVHIREVIKLSL